MNAFSTLEEVLAEGKSTSHSKASPPVFTSPPDSKSTSLSSSEVEVSHFYPYFQCKGWPRWSWNATGNLLIGLPRRWPCLSLNSTCCKNYCTFVLWPMTVWKGPCHGFSSVWNLLLPIHYYHLHINSIPTVKSHTSCNLCSKKHDWQHLCCWHCCIWIDIIWPFSARAHGSSACYFHDYKSRQSTLSCKPLDCTPSE